MHRSFTSCLLALALCACASHHAPAETTPSRPAPRSQPPASAGGRPLLIARPALRECIPPAPVPDRDAAIDALLHGHALEASRLLEALLVLRPWDLAAASFHGASLATAQDDNAAAAAVASQLQTVALEAPALVAPGSGAAPAVAQQSAGATLLREKSVARNLITDDADWLAAHPPADFHGGTNPPAHVAATFEGHELEALFHHPDHTVALYAGSLLVASAEHKLPRAFSAALWPGEPPGNAPPLELAFAQLVGETLLVQLAYNGYAALSSGRNGYLAAFDAQTGRLRWLSPPLSANAGNFVVLGRSVITGYGFTAEPDFVFSFDLGSGALLQKLPVKSGPDVFSVAKRQLFVRTYDMDYVFAIEGAAPTLVEPPALAAAPLPAELPLDPNLACHVRAAAAAIDARNPSALQAAREGLGAHARPPNWIPTILQAAIPFVEALRSGAYPDVWKLQPVVVAKPPWQRAVIAATADLPTSAVPKLRQLNEAKADPVRALDPQPFRPGQPSFIPPVDNGRLPAAAPDVPTHYGLAALGAIIPSGDRTILIYAGRYLAVLRGTSVERMLDLAALREPPKANPQWKEFAVQDASYAQVVSDTLYVCNGGGSYAREVFGKKGFVTAIDLATGALRWRSDALRCNASFAVAGNYLLTGYGFTDEPDYLFALRLADGATVAKAKLASGPDSVTVEGDRVHVETYDHVYDFEWKP